MSDRKQYKIQPIITLLPREDGRYDVDIDWQGEWWTFDPGSSGGEDYGDESPEALAAQAALDEWLNKQPERFIIPPARQ